MLLLKFHLTQIESGGSIQLGRVYVGVPRCFGLNIGEWQVMNKFKHPVTHFDEQKPIYIVNRERFCFVGATFQPSRMQFFDQYLHHAVQSTQ